MLILTGTSLLIPLSFPVTGGDGWLKERLLPTLIAIGAVGGWFAMVSALCVLLVAAIILVTHLMRRNGRAFLSEFYFSLFNATLGICGVLFVFFYGRI